MRSLHIYVVIITMLFCSPGCKKSAQAPDFNYSGTLRSGYPVTFHCNTAENSYNWDFGDGTSSTDAAPGHIFTLPGAYKISLIINGNTAQKIIRSINIDVAPDFTVSGVTAAGNTLRFTPNVPGNGVFLWSFGDGATSTSYTPDHVFATNDTFIISLVLNGDAPHSVKKTIRLFAGAIYLAGLNGNKVFHHTYTSGATPPPVYHTYTYADTTLPVLIDPGTGWAIIMLNDTLSYQSSSNSDSVLVFGHYGLFKNNTIYFNHFTSALTFEQKIHVNAGTGDVYNHYFTN